MTTGRDCSKIFKRFRYHAMVCPVGFGQSWQKSLRMTRLLSKMEGELSVELKLE